MTPTTMHPRLKETENLEGLTFLTSAELDTIEADIRSLSTAIAIQSVVVLGLVALIVYFITQLKWKQRRKQEY